MFTRLAKFRPFEPQRVMPRWRKAMYSNDNLPGRRRLAGELRSPPPALACHWSLNESDGRLECHWERRTSKRGPSATQRRYLWATQAGRRTPFVSASGSIKR